MIKNVVSRKRWSLMGRISRIEIYEGRGGDGL